MGLTFLLPLFLSLFSPSAQAAPSPRQQVSLGSDWKFFQGEREKAESLDFDDTPWAAVEIPHSWPADYRGTGWYRTSFSLGHEAVGKKIFVRFEGVNQVADVYLNGKPLGRHEGGYTAFAFDLTPFLTVPGKNLLAVKVTNAPNPDIAPVSADFTFFGGIYRRVSLLMTAPVQITPLDYASSGVYITPTQVTKQSARVSVKTKIFNGSGGAADLQLEAVLVSAEKKVIGKAVQPLHLEDKGLHTATQEFMIRNPRLWDGKRDPYLYHCVVRLVQGKRILDEVTQHFGLRFFSATPDKGFQLNGNPLRLAGVNMHQDWQGKGWALGSDERKENIRILKDLGANAVRLSHYPHAQETLNLLDKAGIIAWSEIPLVNKVTPSDKFAASTRLQLTEMILQYYNHPSIVFWGLYNELEGDSINLVESLNKLAHSLDSTRLTTAASNQPPGHFLNRRTDVIGINRYDGWYYNKAADSGKSIDSFREGLSGIPVGVSEYGAGASIRQHEDPPQQPAPGGHFHPEEYQSEFHETFYANWQARPSLWGTFVWNLFDFSVLGRDEGDTKSLNDKGLVTYDRSTKKDAYYFYRANWNPEPTLHLAGKRFTRRTSQTANVKVYSNLEKVELFVNGESKGAKDLPPTKAFLWPEVKLKTGKNDILVTGKKDGQEYQEEAEWTAP